MAHVYFHCSNSEGAGFAQRGAAVENFAEVRAHAARVVQSLIMLQDPEDWRDWTLHVSDDLDQEIFSLPFSSVLGEPH
ncbi:DUF6894 family protein [Bradyrhizobium sp. BWA-3-5]|uniref:DUF6894 family protein n=1 Tax=Bradyrhizobium sp. BWA-3-5 TaxID=3080013 RepID=UPI00293E1E41|nr:hypothetical protein [Bradyrhizobium sp. BWA-3-5]WOH63190.1 hypothetical protein RX331_20880 [Bradyrhizobium sp. BWA-3-5]